MLKIQEFCKTHPNNYKEILDKEFAISTKEDGDLVIFKYNQIKFNFNNEMVRECRGIILEKDTWDIACRPFKKFSNYGENYASEIDWESANVTLKQDGSIVKVWYYNGEWRISTNNTINAFDASLEAPFYAEEWDCMISSFGQLFLYTMSEKYGIKDWSFLDDKEEYTHIYEMCSPFNKIVVRYDSPTLFYIASKNNKTGMEVKFDMPTDKVEVFELHSLSDCVDFVDGFGADKEGLVVCDKYLNRIKVKGRCYTHLHHMRGEGAFTEERALDIVRMNEIDEVVSYFPERSSTISYVKMKYDDYIFKAKKYIEYLEGLSDVIVNDRKRFANQVKSSGYADLSFKWIDKKLTTVEDYYSKIPTKKLWEMIDNVK